MAIGGPGVQGTVPIYDEIAFVIDGGGVALTAGLKGVLVITSSYTIVQAQILADQTGSVIVDIFKCTYAQYDGGSTHPVAGDKITSSTPLTIAAGTKATDSTLSGWTTVINAGDIIAFNVNSATTVTRVTVILKMVH